MSTAIQSINYTKTPDPSGETIQLLPGQSRAFFMDKKHTAFVGGIGSGKTFLGALWSFVQTQKKQGNGMIIAPTYRMLEDVTLPEFLRVASLAHLPHYHDIGRGQIHTANGTIYLRSAENPNRLRGPNLSWSWVDEAAMMKELAWDILVGRLRIGGAQSLITTTPSGFNWIYRNWIEKRRSNYGLVQASSKENPHLDADFVAEMIEDYSEQFAAQEIDGQFVAFEGLVYSEFREDIHVFVPFDIPPEWPRYRGIDFGYKNPFVCLWAAEDPDGRLYFYQEHYERRKLLDEHVSLINAAAGSDAENGIRYQWTVADHDAQDCAELHSKGIQTMPAKKSVSPGIQRVKSRFKVQPDGRPRIFFSSVVINTIKELYMYRHNPKAEKEEPLKEHDHAMDTIRYIVAAIDGPRIGVRRI